MSTWAASPRRILAFVGLSAVGLALACHSKPPPPRVDVGELRKRMDREFVRVGAHYAAGTSRQVGRGYLGLPNPPPSDGRLGYELPMEMMQAELANRLFGSGHAESSLPEPVRAKVEPGDFLARIWSIYGPPGKNGPLDAFDYTFVDRRSGVVLTAYVGKGLPAYGGGSRYSGPFPPPRKPGAGQMAGVDPPQVLEVARRFERYLEQAPLADCMVLNEYDDGLYRIGARDSKPFNEKMSFAALIDLYTALAKTGDPKVPEARIRNAWVDAEEAQRQQRPEALAAARRSWMRALEALERNDEYEDWWDHTWEWQHDDAPVLGLDTPELRARLERVRKPRPGVPLPKEDD